MENNFAVLIFDQLFNEQEKRPEVFSDFQYEIENLDLKGEFFLINNSAVFLYQIAADDEIKVYELFYCNASHAANLSYSYNRRVELHIMNASEIERLKNATNMEDYLQSKKDIVAPNHHLVYDKGDIVFFGEIYDAFDY